MPRQEQTVKELLVMKGKVEAYLSIFSKICDKIDSSMMNILVDYGATLIAPLDSYIEELSPLSAGAAEIIQRRLSDVREQFVKSSKESNKEEVLTVFENVRRLCDDLELALTTVGDIRKRSRHLRSN